jgi:urease accessory protein UreH
MTAATAEITSRDFDGRTKTIVEQLYSAYPLRLIKADLKMEPFQSLYVLNYGGGSVDGDEFKVNFKLNRNSHLVVKTAGACRAFKRASKASNGISQSFEYELKDSSFVCSWPDYVIPYKNCKLNTESVYRLDTGLSSSVFGIEWVSSGRFGENWEMFSLCQTTSVFINNKLYFRDSCFLSQDNNLMNSSFAVYANILLLGPETRQLVRSLVETEGYLNQKSGIGSSDMKYSINCLKYPPLKEDGDLIGCYVRLCTRELAIMKDLIEFCFITALPQVPQGIFLRPF